MNARLLILCSVLCLAATPGLAASRLDGRWQLDPTRSSALNFWRTFEVTIATAGDQVVLTRILGYGDRSAREVFELDLTRAVNRVPVDWWADNRYMGLYIGGDGAKHVRATWLDDGRTLRLDSTFAVTTQQGEKTVNILSDYKVSLSGDELTLVELRSSRLQPFVYVFKRATL